MTQASNLYFKKHQRCVEPAEFRRKALDFYRDEITDRLFYEKLAKKISDDQFRSQLLELSRIEHEHASFWEQELKNISEDPSKLKGNRLKIRFLFFVMRLIGPVLTIRMLEHGEIRAISMYKDMISTQAEGSDLRNKLETILDQEINHEDVFEKQIEKTEEEIEKNRDIIYGMSDGLVEVLGSIAGLTAILFDQYLIALGGFVVAISGAMSMSLGSYLSSKSQSEFRIHQIQKESMFDPSKKQKMEIDDLKEKSKKSALTTASYYLLGAFIAIFPFLILSRIPALLLSVTLVAITQAISNSIVALSMNARILRSALRASLLTLLTAAATFAVGEMFHIIFHLTVF